MASFLSILGKIGGVFQKVVNVAASPTAQAIASATPIGAEYSAALDIILTLERLVPQSGAGPAKAAVAIPALQNIFPTATTASLSALNNELVATLNNFAKSNTVPAIA
jgi:hypothetical protein